MLSQFITASKEVSEAIGRNTPIVALESTIISHGMPYPINLETALEVERIIRRTGAIPATIAAIDGVFRVGITEDELAFMATGKDLYKASERDIPFVVARKLSAATTVSASLAIAHASGIRVFATGGIGAVGPDAGKTFDISADLLSLGQYPCITVCSGAKAFMDIAATLEFLETHSIPVVVYQSNAFPLFYSIDSGSKVDWNMRDAEEIADLFSKINSIDPQKGLLVAVSIPPEDAIPEKEIRQAIDKAVSEVNGLGISGKQYTPAVLSLIKDITGGKSLAANVALIKHNAQVAGEISVSLSKSHIEG